MATNIAATLKFTSSVKMANAKQVSAAQQNNE
jgi:hypothetical protein